MKSDRKRLIVEFILETFSSFCAKPINQSETLIHNYENHIPKDIFEEEKAELSHEFYVQVLERLKSIKCEGIMRLLPLAQNSAVSNAKGGTCRQSVDR